MKLIVLALAAGTAVAECPNVSSSVATKAGQRKAAARERPARGSPRHLNAGSGTPAPTETHKRAARGPPSARTARAGREGRINPNPPHESPSNATRGHGAKPTTRTARRAGREERMKQERPLQGRTN